MSASPGITGNRPLTCQSLFETEEESLLHIREGLQYGLISTASFFTCNKSAPLDYELSLNTNTSRDNVLSKGYVYKITGEVIFPNDGTTAPVLNYLPQRAVKDRVVKAFNVKYRVPSNPRLVKTHSMFQKSKEFYFDGFLVGWDSANKMAVIEVVYLAPVGLGGASAVGREESTSSTPNTSPDRKRKLIQWSAAAEPVTTAASSSTNTVLVGQPDKDLNIPSESLATGVSSLNSDNSEPDLPLTTVAIGKKRAKKI
ncbi:hypothetical protein PTTG_25798 [Puccinia triticina 1-1 BBBD Race 1]|uniref:Uncharacterized protein n=1 Tax=Puccinia triticina (isolate 1-1 / race 1 (BBBD)) TaxID=630390 RepID=A0A180H0G2_PUCT1|nr:hypothetical protein PTTG_25798 [Puccinia triticina 1-1 BBBD Race 1]